MTAKKYEYELRAHHGLCLCFFEQKGYSGKFIQNMQKIKQGLEKDPVVRIVNHTDIICSKCPNNICGICKSNEKVCKYDEKVLLRCGISSGENMPFSKFKGLIEQNILLPGKRKEICKDCEWDLLCSRKRTNICRFIKANNQ